MLSASFLTRLELQTEALWATREPRPGGYGFQFQKHTRWNQGLCRAEIEAYQGALGFSFPDDFRLMLSVMNGTDLPTINFYGDSGQPPAHSVGVYSYPRDLELVKAMIEGVTADAAELSLELGIDFPATDKLLPIYAHRYVVCRPDPLESPVVSIWGLDAVYHGDSLESYLTAEFGSRRA